MKVIHSRSTQQPSADWATELHDPILSDGFGPVAAFDQVPSPEPARANRIPRVAAPRPQPCAVALCRRLYRHARSAYLVWQLRDMRGQMDRLEARMAEALELACAMAQRHQHSPSLQARRRAMRIEHTALATEWLRVRQELDNLQAAL